MLMSKEVLVWSMDHLLYCDYAFDYWGKGTAVTVTSATSKGPDVFPLMPCGSGSGDTVTLGCLATGFTPSTLTFSWNQDGSSLTDFIQYPPIQKGSEYMGISQIRVKRQDWEARKLFQCAVEHAEGKGQVPFVKPNMHYQLPDLKLCSSSVEGTHEASFSCFAKDFSPNKFEFKWLKDGRKINSTVEEIVTQSGQRKFTNGTVLYSAASLLTVKTSELITGAKFTCQFNGKGENNTQSQVTNDVTYKECSTGGDGCPNSDVEVKIIEPTSQDMLIKKKGSLICQATVSRGKLERIVWEDVHGKELVSINTTTSKVFKAVLDISYEEWVKGIERICIVHNDAWFEPLKKPYKRQNGEPLRPSVFMLPPLEHTKKDMVVLTCYVKDFYPHDVFVSWSVDDEEAGSSFRPNTTAPIENDGLYSVYSQITLSLEQWQQPDQVYSCAVYHQAIVNSNNAIVRSIGYRTFANTNMVNLNLNVPETCKAE
ncbi:unnamed protein product [Menidia menidia]|uniref:(Atlantic silverside) hypothetical protein n=1 Tax=Menidia menidia TaxID=238744 RepID=A0A8S4AXQ7_9TELE|nr:unnamed protein product [Menidia menidia]